MTANNSNEDFIKKVKMYNNIISLSSLGGLSLGLLFAHSRKSSVGGYIGWGILGSVITGGIAFVIYGNKMVSLVTSIPDKNINSINNSVNTNAIISNSTPYLTYNNLYKFFGGKLPYDESIFNSKIMPSLTGNEKVALNDFLSKVNLNSLTPDYKSIKTAKEYIENKYGKDIMNLITTKLHHR